MCMPYTELTTVSYPDMSRKRLKQSQKPRKSTYLPFLARGGRLNNFGSAFLKVNVITSKIMQNGMKTSYSYASDLEVALR